MRYNIFLVILLVQSINSNNYNKTWRIKYILHFFLYTFKKKNSVLCSFPLLLGYWTFQTIIWGFHPFRFIMTKHSLNMTLFKTKQMKQQSCILNSTILKVHLKKKKEERGWMYQLTFIFQCHHTTVKFNLKNLLNIKQKL